MNTLRILIFIAIYLKSASNAPVYIQTNIDQIGLNFLTKYGYVVKPDPRSGKLLDEHLIADGLKALQRMGGLPETGVLNEETKKLIASPRCGMPDFAPTDNAKRKKRFKKHGTTWSKGNLTWSIVNSNNDAIKDAEVKEVLVKAFNKWSSVTNLDFKESKDKPDIRVQFTRAYHNDPSPFDGPGGELAHAFHPDTDDLAGDVHFDDDELFTVRSSKGRDLLWVAVHELGHSIGLDHSGTKGAVMFPIYQPTNGNDFNLNIDDIKGAQSLYGERQSRVTTPQPAPGTTVKVGPPSRICLAKFQAGVLTKEKKTYIVNGGKSYILDRYLKIEKGPVATSKLFGGVAKIDAMFKRQWDDKIIAFSGSKYYVFEETRLVGGPFYISDGFKGLPTYLKVKAAFVWPGNDQLYVFSGRQYWRFSRIPNEERYRMDYYYPRKIRSGWKGVPEDFDSVFAWRNRKTYFFKGDKYYRLNDRKLKIEYGYPRSIWEDWTRCPARLVAVGSAASSLTYGLSQFIIIPFLYLLFV